MKVIKILTISISFLLLSSCNSKGIANKELKNEVDSVSYALGLNTAYQMKQTKEIDKDLFIQGLNNGIDSTNILIEKEKINEIIGLFFQKQRVKQQAEALKKLEEKYADVKEAGIKFLEENKKKKGVNVTESGLQYIVLKEGTGEKPTVASKVKVNYHGTSIDGEVFDSSIDRGKPAEFYVNGVIKGWTEGLQLMKVGSKYKFFVPQELAYGASPRRGGPIKPYQALVFELELLDIIK